MNTKKSWLVVPLVFGLVALFLLGRAWQANESVGDSLKENDTTVTAVIEKQEGTTTGAIAEAKGLSGKNDQSLKDEASQFGLDLWSSDINNYKYIRDRLFANEALASAIRTAEDEGVRVDLERGFSVNTGWVGVDVEATDQEIVEFLATSTPEAKAKQIAFYILKDEASQFGLDLWSSDINDYKYIRDRLFANEALASAIRTAEDEGVRVDLERGFSVNTGWVGVDVEATDQEIVEFLLGK